MPAALERKLKRQVSKKKISKERKDAYVYGTLRKTGWKPSREKNHKHMSIPNERMVRLEAIDKTLDSIIQFQYEGDDTRSRYGLLKTGAGVGAGVGATILHQAIARQGGYGAAWKAGKGAFKTATEKTGQALLPGMEAVGAAAKGVGSSVGSALGKVWKPVSKVARRFLESNEKPIRLDATLLEPFQGSSFKSKIEEEQFPAGLSPAAALRLPFPKLMALLNQRNLLQQVYSEKIDKLIELNEKLDLLSQSATR
jgi:hypothetical protein